MNNALDLETEKKLIEPESHTRTLTKMTYRIGFYSLRRKKIAFLAA